MSEYRRVTAQGGEIKAPSEKRHESRAFPICKDHQNADWNQPAVDDHTCVLCRLFYLEAQESLLEEWQQRAERAEHAIAEIERPLDAQMARLNTTVARLNGENERLQRELETAQSATPQIDKRRESYNYEQGDRERDEAYARRIVRRCDELERNLAEANQAGSIPSHWRASAESLADASIYDAEAGRKALMLVKLLLNEPPSANARGVGLSAHEASVIAAAVQLAPLLEEGWDDQDAPEDRNEGAKACDALVEAVRKMLGVNGEAKP